MFYPLTNKELASLVDVLDEFAEHDEKDPGSITVPSFRLSRRSTGIGLYTQVVVKVDGLEVYKDITDYSVW